MGEAACAKAAADAFAKFETHPDWLAVHKACQQHLLPVEEVVRLVVRATGESLEGIHACQLG